MLKKQTDTRAFRVKFTIEDEEKEVARASLYVLFNDLHEQPYGLLEDVFVDETYRGKGYGREVIHSVIEEAKAQNCYKLIATSRESRVEVHTMYEKYGFQKYGFEFRINFE
jgi:GNAT superfamily N-acetyltransferase